MRLTLTGASRNRQDIDGITIYSKIYVSTSAKYQSIPDGYTYASGHIIRSPYLPTIWGSAQLGLGLTGVSRKRPEMN
jgi:hypothetical protein